MSTRRLWSRCIAALTLMAGALAAHADDQTVLTLTPPPEPAQVDAIVLEGTLAKVATSGTMALGYREASLPFSFLGRSGNPVGYSIDLCQAVVRAAELRTHRKLAVKWVPVTSDSRFDAVTSGKIDLECGSTTSNLERQQRVAFSPVFFISGAKLMVPNGSRIRNYRGLSGKTVVYTSGTTTEKALRELFAKNRMNVTLVAARDHADAFAQLAAGKADAMANDDVLLYGFIARERAQGRGGFKVVGDFLSYEPYGLMYRKNDPQMQNLVDDTFRKLAGSGELESLYEYWFLRKLPNGMAMSLPISPHLSTVFETLKIKTAP